MAGPAAGCRPAAGFGTGDWLATPTQALAEVTGGACSHDPAGELAAIRAAPVVVPARRLAVRPGRAVVADRRGGTVRRPRRRGRRRAGLDRGRGPAGARPDADLPAAAPALPAVRQVAGFRVRSVALRPGPDPGADRGARRRRPGEREARLGQAYRAVAELQNAAGLCDAGATRPCGAFYSRPFWVLSADQFAEALLATVTDPELAGRRRLRAVDCYLETPSCSPIRPGCVARRRGRARTGQDGLMESAARVGSEHGLPGHLVDVRRGAAPARGGRRPGGDDRRRAGARRARPAAPRARARGAGRRAAAPFRASGRPSTSLFDLYFPAALGRRDRRGRRARGWTTTRAGRSTSTRCATSWPTCCATGTPRRWPSWPAPRSTRSAAPARSAPGLRGDGGRTELVGLPGAAAALPGDAAGPHPRRAAPRPAAGSARWPRSCCAARSASGSPRSAR